MKDKGPAVRPYWIRGRFSWDENSQEIKSLLTKSNLNSVCVEAACPNKGDCWEKKHITFMILGDRCTRNCLFCNVKNSTADSPDGSEPKNIAKVVKELGMKYVVITSVTRDDLEDKGALHFLEVVKAIKKIDTSILIELLIPDFNADINLLCKIAFSGANVIAHNIEIPEVLYPVVRPEADYARSLHVLSMLNKIKEDGASIFTKSSMILGLGETREDILSTLEDLKIAGVDIVYIGQYLSPSRLHWPVEKYYTPEEFKFFEDKAKRIGLGIVRVGPMIRSSYGAHDAYRQAKKYASS